MRKQTSQQSTDRHACDGMAWPGRQDYSPQTTPSCRNVRKKMHKSFSLMKYFSISIPLITEELRTTGKEYLSAMQNIKLRSAIMNHTITRNINNIFLAFGNS